MAQPTDFSMIECLLVSLCARWYSQIPGKQFFIVSVRVCQFKSGVSDVAFKGFKKSRKNW